MNNPPVIVILDAAASALAARLRAALPGARVQGFAPRTKTAEGVETLYRTVEALRPCRPSFVSVTYGAGGSTRDRTLELVARIQAQFRRATTEPSSVPRRSSGWHRSR